MQERNRQVKDYICTPFCEDPPAMEEALKKSREAGLKEIQVPQNVAKAIYLLAKLVQPKRILEIGTLGGYSALWLAKALGPEGKLITLECEAKHAQVAKENFYFANVSDQIEIRLGDASILLEEMIKVKEAPFDLIFLDADKDRYPDYLKFCINLSRPGTLILSDNLIPKRGEIGQPDPRDNEAVGIYAYNQLLAEHPQLESIPLSMIVGEKGRVDALGLTIVNVANEDF